MIDKIFYFLLIKIFIFLLELLIDKIFYFLIGIAERND